MTPEEKLKLKLSLLDVLNGWLDDETPNVRSFPVGEQTAYLMADAAMAVFLAVEDLHGYLQESGELPHA